MRFWIPLIFISFFTATFAAQPLLTLPEPATQIPTYPPFTNNPQVRTYIADLHQKHGFSTHALTVLFRKATVQTQVIPHMTHPFEQQTWDVYRPHFITPKRLERGMAFWQSYA